MASLSSTHILGNYLRQVLRPIVRLALKHGLRLPDMLESLRSVFVEVATEEIQLLKQKPTVSRLAVTTGMNRRDVHRAVSGTSYADITLSLPTRVIGLWLSHKDFTNKQGKPRVLSVQGADCEFNALVQLVSHDVHPASVLFELERVGAVVKSARGVQLLMTGYIPADPEQGIRMLSQDLEQLIFAVDENLFSRREDKNLHIRTVSSQFSSQDAPVIRDWLLREGGAFHRRVRDFLADFDLQLRPRSGVKADSQIVITSFARLSANRNLQSN